MGLGCTAALLRGCGMEPWETPQYASGAQRLQHPVPVLECLVACWLLRQQHDESIPLGPCFTGLQQFCWLVFSALSDTQLCMPCSYFSESQLLRFMPL